MGVRLVRDHVAQVKDFFPPNFIELIRPVRNDAEHDRLLQQKLLEEVGELIAATCHEEVLEEAVDIFEVLRAIIERAGYDLMTLLEVADEKREERGGFTKGFAWEV